MMMMAVVDIGAKVGCRAELGMTTPKVLGRKSKSKTEFPNELRLAGATTQGTIAPQRTLAFRCPPDGHRLMDVFHGSKLALHTHHRQDKLHSPTRLDCHDSPGFPCFCYYHAVHGSLSGEARVRRGRERRKAHV